MSTQMIHALEENGAALLLAMGRAGGGEERNTGGIAWTVGGSPLDYHNAVVRAELTEATVDQEINAFQAALTQKNVPGSWHLGPTMRPATSGERLLAHGFTNDGDDLGMGLELRSYSARISMPAELNIKPVSTLQQLANYADILAQGFGEGEREARWVQEIFAGIGLETATSWQHLVGYAGQEPVTTVTLFYTGDTVGLYFIATAPAWRQRGLGAAITAGALEAARERGAQRAVLFASSMGHSVYRRVGFADLAPIGIYTWRPPAFPSSV
jgi:GNAT superfamily N-acetyltransferase